MTIEAGAAAGAAPALRILNASPGQDTAGQGIRIKRAFDRHSKAFAVRTLIASETYIEYPTDLRIGRDVARHAVAALWREADVVHANNYLRPYARYQREDPRPLILHHHGTPFRSDPVELDRQAHAAGAIQLVSTMDLLFYGRDLTWLPAPYDLDELAAIRAREYVPSDRIRIAHAPTNRVIKSTDLIVEVVERLAERYPIELDLIERVPWAECLARKGRADIFVDQLLLGYGCNAIEAWGMGIPVVAGAEPRVLERMTELLGELPFHAATVEDLEERIEELVVDVALRRSAAERGQVYVRRWHDEARVVEQLEAIYRAALAGASPGPIANVSRVVQQRPTDLVRVEVEPGVVLRLSPDEARAYGWRPDGEAVA